MAGFNRVKGGDRGSIRYTISSLALAIGDLVDFSRTAGTVVKATASSTIESLAGVVQETTTSSDTSVLVQKIEEGDEYIINTTNNSNATHNYQRMLLTDENEMNNTGTDDTTDAAIFMQLSPVGATADKKIRGKFVTIQDRAA
jgi:hypothetical protein